MAIMNKVKERERRKGDFEVILYLSIYVYPHCRVSKLVALSEIFRFCSSHNWKIAHKLHKQRGRKLLSFFFVVVAKRCSCGGQSSKGRWVGRGGSVRRGWHHKQPLRWLHCACALKRKVGKFYFSQSNDGSCLIYSILPPRDVAGFMTDFYELCFIWFSRQSGLSEGCSKWYLRNIH